MSIASLLVSASGIWLFFRLQKEIDFFFLKNFLPYFINAAASAVLVFILINILPESFINLSIILISGMICYLLLILLFARKALHKNFQSLASIFKEVFL
jgi:zinc transporter ZupT